VGWNGSAGDGGLALGPCERGEVEAAGAAVVVADGVWGPGVVGEPLVAGGSGDDAGAAGAGLIAGAGGQRRLLGGLGAGAEGGIAGGVADGVPGGVPPAARVEQQVRPVGGDRAGFSMRGCSQAAPKLTSPTGWPVRASPCSGTRNYP
jgi:hypothetical protein